LKKTQDILKLKPTQFAVGMLEVDQKIEELRSLKKKALKKYVAETPVPIVVSPHGALYLVDHHHFLCVCYHLGVKKVRVRVIEDLSKSKLSFSQFWRWMHRKKQVYPFCQFGEGPRKALYLPRDIRGLADDPYRSLAWFVRKAGGFDNSEKNFAEFQWANFFRAKGLLDRHGTDGFAQALVKATRLANSEGARGLPGYGRLNPKEQVTAEKKAHKRAKKVVEILK
jgi:hypothetical protein